MEFFTSKWIFFLRMLFSRVNSTWQNKLHLKTKYTLFHYDSWIHCNLLIKSGSLSLALSVSAISLDVQLWKWCTPETIDFYLVGPSFSLDCHFVVTFFLSKKEKISFLCVVRLSVKGERVYLLEMYYLILGSLLVFVTKLNLHLKVQY